MDAEILSLAREQVLERGVPLTEEQMFTPGAIASGRIDPS